MVWLPGAAVPLEDPPNGFMTVGIGAAHAVGVTARVGVGTGVRIAF